MQAVGADHQVEAAGRGVLEGDVHAVGVLVEGGDGVVEEVLDVGGGGPVQHGGQVVAEHFEVGHDAFAAEEFGGHPGDVLPVPVDQGDAALVDGELPDLVEQAHPFDDGASGAAQVDGLAAGPGCGRALHHDGTEAGLA